MFRAKLIHSFAVYFMLLTLDFGLSTQQYNLNGLARIHLKVIEINERENQQDDTIRNQNHIPHTDKEFKMNSSPDHDTKTAHSARSTSGSKKGPIDEEPKDDESQYDESKVNDDKNYPEDHSGKVYRALRHAETEDDATGEDVDEDREPEDKHSENNENEDSEEDSSEDVDPEEKNANNNEEDHNENSIPIDNSTTNDNNTNENTKNNGNSTTYENPDSNENSTTYNGTSTTGGNSTANGTVPDQWDWREHGFLTEVGNQGNGNFCWSFAASGVLEGYNFIKTKQLETLSMQQLIDCDKVIEPEAPGFNGAHTVESAFRYVKKYGIETNESYPFTGQEGTECRYDAEKATTKINNFTSLNHPKEIEMQQILVTYGPIAVLLNAGDLVKKPDEYQGGIYDGCNTEMTNELTHAVVAVGYGTDNGKDYWILKNSWGTGFGEKGYFKLPRNINACQITQDVLYVE